MSAMSAECPIESALKDFPTAQASYHRQFLQTYAFNEACKRIFQQVKQNNINGITKPEMFQAFKLVLDQVPDAKAALAQLSDDPFSVGNVLGVNMVNQVFSRLDTRGQGILDIAQYVNGVRLLYLKTIKLKDIAVKKVLENQAMGAMSSLGFNQNIIDASLQQLQIKYPHAEKDIRRLKYFFVSDQFANICRRVFFESDRDGSGSIDAGELLNAFKTVLLRVPGVVDVLRNAGADPDWHTTAFGQDMIRAVYQRLDRDGNGLLTWNEFPDAMRFAWIEAYKLVQKANLQAQGNNALIHGLIEAIGDDTMCDDMCYAAASRLRLQEAQRNAVLDKCLAEYRLLAGADKAAYLMRYFHTDEFRDICGRVFRESDVDRSNSIDPNECLDAFKLVLRQLPGVVDSLARQGIANPLIHSHLLGEDIVRKCYSLLDVDGSGSLEAEEFVHAVMLIWIEANKIVDKTPDVAVLQHKSKSDSIVEVLLGQLALQASPEEASRLRSFFVSQEFADICSGVFARADLDNSGSIDRTEVLAAFKLVMQGLPGVNDALVKLGTNIMVHANLLGKDVVEQCFTLLDTDGTGSLDKDEFVNCVRVIWVESMKLIDRASKSDSGGGVGVDLGGNNPFIHQQESERVQAVERTIEVSFQELARTAGEDAVNEIKAFWQQDQFLSICQEVWHAVDADRSGSVDKSELLAAFQLMLERLPGLDAAMRKLGTDSQDLAREVGLPFVQGLFHQLDVDHSGKLEQDEFPGALKLIWVEAAKVVAKAAGSVEGAGVGGVKRKGYHSPRKTGKRLRPPNFGTVDALVEEYLKSMCQLKTVQAASQARDYFIGSEFHDMCVDAFVQVDRDNSASIDKEELLEAFKWSVDHAPGVRDKLQAMGAEWNDINRLGGSLVQEVMNRLGGGGLVALSFAHFKSAVQIMWVKLLCA